MEVEAHKLTGEESSTKGAGSTFRISVCSVPMQVSYLKCNILSHVLKN